MAATNINRVVLTGNLTRDPELRSLPSGMSVCSLRVACNTRRKNNSTGEWEDKPNYFDVTVWGAQGENCARFLSKGRPIALDGRLEWREWQDKEGNKRQSIDIIADAVQFLGSRDDARAAVAAASRRAPTCPSTRATSSPPARRRQRRASAPPTTTSRSEPRPRRPAPLRRSGRRSRLQPRPPTLSGPRRRRAHSAAVSADSLLRARSFNSGEAAQPADAPA